MNDAPSANDRQLAEFDYQCGWCGATFDAEVAPSVTAPISFCVCCGNDSLEEA